MDVKRIVAYVLLGSALGLVFFVFYFIFTMNGDDFDETPFWWRGNSYAGTVTAIGEDRLTLEVKNGVVREFKIDANTRFFLNRNRPVGPGVQAKILFREMKSPGGPYLLARTVRVLPEATPSPGASAPAPSDSPAASPSAGAPKPSPAGAVATPSAAPATPGARPGAGGARPSPAPR